MPRLMIFVTSAVLAFGAVQLLAHEQLQVRGTITSRQDSRLELKMDNGRKVSIGLTEGTQIWRGTTSRDTAMTSAKKVSVTELKTGRTVVVDAYGDSLADCVAIVVRIVPPASSSSPKK